MPKELDKGSWNLLYTLLIIYFVAITITYVLFIGMVVQIKGLLDEASQDINKLSNLSEVIRNYASIALTLFGITFIGGIFELYKFRTQDIKEYFTKRAMIMIFSLSIVFLFTFIDLSILYSFIYPRPIHEDVIVYSMLIGIILFVLGIITLLIILIIYLKSILKKEEHIDVVD
jgi:hypothetical protein